MSTWSLVSSGWEHVKRIMHHCLAHVNFWPFLLPLTLISCSISFHSYSAEIFVLLVCITGCCDFFSKSKSHVVLNWIHLPAAAVWLVLIDVCSHTSSPHLCDLVFWEKYVLSHSSILNNSLLYRWTCDLILWNYTFLHTSNMTHCALCVSDLML